MLLAARFHDDLDLHATAFVTYYIDNNYQDVSDDLYHWVTDAIDQLSETELINWMYYHHHDLATHNTIVAAPSTTEFVNWDKLRRAIASYVTYSLLNLIVDELDNCGTDLLNAAKVLNASTVVTNNTLNRS